MPVPLTSFHWPKPVGNSVVQKKKTEHTLFWVHSSLSTYSHCRQLKVMLLLGIIISQPCKLSNRGKKRIPVQKVPTGKCLAGWTAERPYLSTQFKLQFCTLFCKILIYLLAKTLIPNDLQDKATENDLSRQWPLGMWFLLHEPLPKNSFLQFLKQKIRPPIVQLWRPMTRSQKKWLLLCFPQE